MRNDRNNHKQRHKDPEPYDTSNENPMLHFPSQGHEQEGMRSDGQDEQAAAWVSDL